MKLFGSTMRNDMICDLKKAREIELSDAPNNVCFFYNFNGTLSSLHAKGLVKIKPIAINGREVLSVIVTEAGIHFLKRHEENKKQLSTSEKWNIL